MFLLEKAPGHFSFVFFFFFKKQNMEDQMELNPVTFWNSNSWKAYLCHADLDLVPVKKATLHFSLLAWFHNCLCISANQTEGTNYCSQISLLVRLLQRSFPQEMALQTKENRIKTLTDRASQSYPTRGAAHFPT
jgi:hypothetical protein